VLLSASTTVTAPKLVTKLVLEHRNQKFWLGCSTWTIEFSPVEWEQFVQQFRTLAQTWQSIQEELMPEEALTLDSESETIRLQAEGQQEQWGMWLQICSGRKVEGYLEPPLVMELLKRIGDSALAAEHIEGNNS
jgi:Domain of unknown function (DUF1818)